MSHTLVTLSHFFSNPGWPNFLSFLTKVYFSIFQSEKNEGQTYSTLFSMCVFVITVVPPLVRPDIRCTVIVNSSTNCPPHFHCRRGGFIREGLLTIIVVIEIYVKY